MERLERSETPVERRAGTTARKPSERRAAMCVSCGTLAALAPEPIFGGLAICRECTSHVHFPSIVEPAWVANAT